MACNQFERDAIDALKDAIKANPMTLSVTVDGQQIQFAGLKERQWQLDQWQKAMARSSGKKPRIASITMNNSF